MPAESTPSAPSTATRWRTRLVRAQTQTGWDGGRWTSDVLEPGWGAGIGADQAVASWNLEPGIPALVEIRARTTDGRWHEWQRLASWGAPGERRSAEATDAHGADAGPAVETDILTGGPDDLFDGVRLRVTVDVTGEGDGAAHPVRLAAVSFTAPCAPDAAPGDCAPGAGAVGASAALRSLSQRAYPARPDLGGGGPAWCSPTSLTMVALAWGQQLPSAAAEDAPAGADPRVPWVARAVYDAVYDGTGNWSFNAALAGELGFDAVVTRLSSPASAQTLTDAGVPLIASISFRAGELPGADYDSPGHLVVVRGFDERGDVLVADPANSGGEDALRTYPRDAFDAAWSRSRRTVYLIAPRGHALPAPGAAAEW